MKIVYVLENYDPHIGGVEIVFKQLAEHFAATSHDVHVITHRLPGTAKEEVKNSVKIHRVSVPPFLSRYFFTFLAIPLVVKIAKGADIIHTTTYNAALPAMLAARWRHVPSLITVHEVLGEKWYQIEMGKLEAAVHKFLEKRIVRLSFDKAICVSHSTQRDLLKVNKKANSMVIYNGVDTVFWDPKKYSGIEIRKGYHLEKTFVYLFYGRPGAMKGLEYLLQAVPEISQKIPHSKLFIILSKDKAYSKRHQKMLLLAQKFKDQVILIDPVSRDELPKYIKMADCVVIPSLSEGFGFTTVESCLMQKPVVVSNTSSLPEVVFGQYVLVEPKNSHAIAKGVIDIFLNKAKTSDKRNFSLKKNLDAHERLYKEMARRKE